MRVLEKFKNGDQNKIVDDSDDEINSDHSVRRRHQSTDHSKIKVATESNSSEEITPRKFVQARFHALVMGFSLISMLVISVPILGASLWFHLCACTGILLCDMCIREPQFETRVLHCLKRSRN